MVNPTRELWPDCMQKCKAILGNSICCSFQAGYTWAVLSRYCMQSARRRPVFSYPLASWLPEVSGGARFPWMVKGTPDAGKSSRTCDVDAEAADRRSRLPIDEPERR
jgi:hypothetical protein